MAVAAGEGTGKIAVVSAYSVCGASFGGVDAE